MRKTDGGDSTTAGKSSRSRVEGERKQVTVLFADVAGFTTLSEVMDPEEVSDLIQPAVDLMSEEVRRHGGTITQFLGDGVMALFGAPVAYEDSPRRAVHAALAIQERLSEYSEELSGAHIDLEVRIGLNTGLVVTGSVGEDAAMTYTAIGDTVNLASRMESTARRGTIQVTEDTYRLTRGYFDFEELGARRVKGRREPVRSYRPLKPRVDRRGVHAFVRSGFSRFTGRSVELDSLVRWYEEARSGRGMLVTVSGEPGVGKSRLVRELRLGLPEGDFTYLEGGCLHYGDAIAYLPVLQILKHLFGISGGENGAAAREKVRGGLVALGIDLEAALSPLEEALSLGVEEESYLLLDPPQRRERVFEAIGNVLLAESRTRTLVLVIEDLHWIDRTSEEFLARFAGRIAEARILLLVLYRPGYTPVWAGDANTLRLEQLAEGTSSDLIASLFPDARASRELNDFIFTRAAGNPLFIEELAHSLIEGGYVIREGDLCVLSGEPSDLKVPDTVQGIIASRLDRLDVDSKTTIQVAACIGREFSRDLIDEVVSLEGELDEILTCLKQREFIYERSTSKYAFKHALTQDVACDSLLLKSRRNIHARIGHAIEHLYPNRVEEFYELLAEQYSKSDEIPEAIRYLRLSGEKAGRAFSNWEAVHFYREAKTLLDGQPETEANRATKLEVCLALQDPLAFLNYPEGSVELLEETERLAEELQDNDSLADIFRKSSRYYAARGNAARAIDFSERSLELARKTGDIDTMARVAFDVGSTRSATGDPVGAAEISRDALRVIQDGGRERDLYYSGDWTAHSALSGCCGLALAALGEFNEAEDVLSGGLANSRSSDDPLGEVWILYCFLTVHFYRGDVAGLIEKAKAVIGRFEEVGTLLLLGTCWSYLACGVYFTGDMGEAREIAEKGVEMGRATGLPTNLPLSLVALSLAESGTGDFEAAENAAREALELSRAFKTRQFEAYALIALGTAAANARPSDPEAPVRHVRQGIEIAKGQQRKPSVCHGLIFLGEILSLAGRRDEAIEGLERAEALAVEMGMGYWLDRAREALARLATD